MHGSLLISDDNTTGATCGAGNVYPSGAPAPEFTPVLMGFVLLDL